MRGAGQTTAPHHKNARDDRTTAKQIGRPALRPTERQEPIVALRKTMPARDPQRAEAEPQHSRDYAASRGGYTSSSADRPVAGTPKKGSRS